MFSLEIDKYFPYMFTLHRMYQSMITSINDWSPKHYTLNKIGGFLNAYILDSISYFWLPVWCVAGGN